MHIRSLLLGSLVATTLALGSMSAAFADDWGGLSNVAKEAAESYLDAKYATELQGHDVSLTKSEFTPGPVGHLAVDVIFDGAFGGTLVYNPATDAVYAIFDGGAASKLLGTPETVAMYCPTASAAGSCTGETLVGNAGGAITKLVTDAVDATCEWQAKFRDKHSC